MMKGGLAIILTALGVTIWIWATLWFFVALFIAIPLFGNALFYLAILGIEVVIGTAFVFVGRKLATT